MTDPAELAFSGQRPAARSFQVSQTTIRARIRILDEVAPTLSLCG
jgi:hypothetical protein